MKKIYFSRTGKVGACIKLMLLLVVMGIGEKSWGQVNGDYRSLTTGNWLGTATATWERYNGAAWISNAAPLSSTANTVYIRHSVSAGASFANTIKLVIETGGTFTVTASSTAASIQINSGGTLQINSTLQNLGAFTIESGGRANLNTTAISGVSTLWSGTENFKSGSTVEIQNWNYNAGGNDKRLIQNTSLISANTTGGYYFGNLIISGNPSSNFVMVASSQTIKLAENNFTSSTTAGSSKVAFTNSGSNVTIGGNLIVTSDQFSFAATTTGDPIATVNGDISITGGTIDLNQNSSGTATSTVQLKGMLNIPASTTLKSTDAGCKIVFSGTGEQTLSIPGTLGTNVGFEVASGTTTKFINQSLALTNASNSFSVLAGGTLYFNGFDITGAGTFSQASTSSLKITSALGINATGNTGNVQNTGTRTFSQTGYFYFTGNANPQATGSAITSGSTAKRIFIDKANATDVVNLTQSTGTTDQLTITNGIFVETNTSTVTGSGVLNMATGGTYRIPILSVTVPQLSGATYTLSAGSTIELNGAGDQILRGARDYANLSFLTSGTKTLTSAPSTITGTVTVSGSAILNVADNTMGGVGTNLTMTGTAQYITASTGTKPDAQGTYSLAAGTKIEFANSNATLQAIRLAPTYANIDISGTNVGISTSTGSITMQASTTFTVKTGGVFNVQNTNGFSGTTSTSIKSTNSPTITLATNSTINYNGAAQAITNQLSYQNLTLSGSGVKTATVGTLTILGNLSRSGTHSFAAGTGRVSFAGTAQQVYSADVNTTPIEFYDVANTNTVGLRIDSTIGIQNELNLTSTAKLELNTGNVNLRSTNTRTAYVTDLGTTGASTNITYTGAGRFNIERYLPSVKSWRLLAAPVVSEGLSITDAWREGASSLASTGYGTQITGPASSNGMDAVTTRGSMKWYNKATNTYTEITNTADAIARPQGYYVFVRGDRAQNVAGAGSATNLRMKGKILTGSQTFSALAPTTAFDGFESVGNPYPSQINFKTVTKTNIEPTYTVWNPSGGFYGVGRFVQYVSDLNGDYKNGGNTVNTIESGQAFFIQSAIGVAGSITIKESDKATGSNTVSRNGTENRAGVTVPTLEVDLNEVITSDSTNFLDQVVLHFDAGYSNSFDGNDVRKFMNSTDNLAIKVGTRNLILERRAPLTITDTIYLSLTNTRIASYQFEIDPSVLGNLPLNAYLVDKFLVTETPVSLTAVTTVPFSTTSDAASRAADRFKIVFRPGGVLPVTFTGIAASVNTDKTHTVKWFVSNEVNLTGYAIERSANGVRFDAIGNAAVAGNTAYSFIDASPLAGVNYYRVKATSANGQVQYSAIVKLSSAATQPAFSIQPNPVIDKTIHINFENMKGSYSMKLLSKQGATVFTKQINVASFNEVQHILMDAIAAGVYDVVLVNAKGNQTVQTIIIQ